MSIDLTDFSFSSKPYFTTAHLSHLTEAMADEIKIDKEVFQNRLSHFISTWKNDRRQSNDALFGGVGSIVVLMGRNEDNPAFHKNNAMHVRASSEHTRLRDSHTLV